MGTCGLIKRIFWFGTYEAVNCYRRRTDDFEHWQIPKPGSGDTIREDYYAFHLDRKGQLWLRLNDAQGRLVRKEVVTIDATGIEMTFTVHGLPPGIYTLTVLGHTRSCAPPDYVSR